jgi:hypothetical protein
MHHTIYFKLCRFLTKPLSSVFWVARAVLRVWDVLLFEDNRTMLFRTALALIDMNGKNRVTSSSCQWRGKEYPTATGMFPECG